ncbi:hypothetical protein [Aeropyrum camini]|uniref:Deoxyxylulose-5-phosphate synthase n=1 Tax=Aeropyrum camini SY1 = JCM 12091 TaxID=1198449 RepID=U3T8I8_9CREN|nr:hypothetical protein [Aeropyrum camini]BAN89842.1 deoxyxylulose-5-phosphate synthase [Aeropyrum camini SY1 = JCM 12091]
MRRGHPVKMIELVPGLGIPEYMDFLLIYCQPINHTRKAIEAGHLLSIDYHPPYLQFKCNDIEKVVSEAKRRGLRVYKAKKHITITDGIYQVRIYNHW